MVDVFVAQPAQTLPLALNAAEVMQTRWMPRAELIAQVNANPALFTPWLKIYLDAGVAALSTS